MQLGVVFPQREIGSDPAAIRAVALGVEELGYEHVLVYEHVAGAVPPPRRRAGPYDAGVTYHEPFVLFGFLAALTRLQLVTAVLVLPQRQTVLVAKQAAEADVLSGGRVRLGVGVGWNAVEYRALGMTFADRGSRIEDQVVELRKWWSHDVVPVDRAHVELLGISPRPVQRPIPVWFGGQSTPAYRRIGRMGDGWFPQMQPGPELDQARRVVAQSAIEAGRDPDVIGMEGRLPWSPDIDRVVRGVAAWERSGATHLSVNTMGCELTGVDEHLAALAQVADAWGRS